MLRDASICGLRSRRGRRDGARRPGTRRGDAVTVIEVDRLHKEYRAKVAVDEVRFEVQQGEIFGIIGPNGAGKTTIAECIEGLRVPDRGTIRVLGLDPSATAMNCAARLAGSCRTARCLTS